MVMVVTILKIAIVTTLGTSEKAALVSSMRGRCEPLGSLQAHLLSPASSCLRSYSFSFLDYIIYDVFVLTNYKSLGIHRLVTCLCVHPHLSLYCSHPDLQPLLIVHFFISRPLFTACLTNASYHSKISSRVFDLLLGNTLRLNPSSLSRSNEIHGFGLFLKHE